MHHMKFINNKVLKSCKCKNIDIVVFQWEYVHLIHGHPEKTCTYLEENAMIFQYYLFQGLSLQFHNLACIVGTYVITKY